MPEAGGIPVSMCSFSNLRAAAAAMQAPHPWLAARLFFAPVNAGKSAAEKMQAE